MKINFNTKHSLTVKILPKISIYDTSIPEKTKSKYLGWIMSKRLT